MPHVRIVSKPSERKRFRIMLCSNRPEAERYHQVNLIQRVAGRKHQSNKVYSNRPNSKCILFNLILCVYRPKNAPTLHIASPVFVNSFGPAISRLGPNISGDDHKGNANGHYVGEQAVPHIYMYIKHECVRAQTCVRITPLNKHAQTT